ncbi:hypothetical protein QQF64_016261 [Cirrhinus molitorella]|uniref:Uncharacterized protein n=1 Tax=Cirrhinus molitorella TaxID=172907 RepID=A0ABR3LMD1_9TELE
MSEKMFFGYEEFDVWFWRPVNPALLRGVVGNVLGSDRFISALLDHRNSSCYRENFCLSLTQFCRASASAKPLMTYMLFQQNAKTCLTGLVVVSGALVSWASSSASVAPLIKAIRAQRMFTLTRKITVTTNSCCVRVETRALMSACEHELLTFSRGAEDFGLLSSLLSLHVMVLCESNYKFRFRQVVIGAFLRGPVSAWYVEGISSSTHPEVGGKNYDICLRDTTGYYSSCPKQEKDNKRLVNQLNHNPLSSLVPVENRLDSEQSSPHLYE